MDILKEISRVIELEGLTVDRLRKSVGDGYEKAVHLIFESHGKVVLTGIGKSGLIAQKIASTMVSTGTPATFLHPAEGMHGDIGIVHKDDIVIAISKSGESDELIALLPSIRKIGARLIAITAKQGSMVAKNAEIVLITPIDEEACPLNMAPTCSTTAALVVGDALAITLMKLRNFQPENFALYHPGGQLGKRLLLDVKDVMRAGDANPVIESTVSVKEMLFEITNKRAGAVSVVGADRRLLGLVTDYDIRRALEKWGNVFAMSISDLMNKTPTFVYEDEKAIRALEIMENRDKPFLVLPVLNRQEEVIGMIHLHDLVAKGL
ncbi:MAG: KpsF/GutQ family sugar-phosphate isomerase [Nitrospira sp.]|nr:KpsF/GutQ family sugar-phosphate isomerase [Nitrospira sp.]